MVNVQQILLVEDDPNDVELTLTAFEQSNLANRVDVVNDGEAAIAYLRRTGQYADRTSGNPSAVLLDIKLPKVNGVEVLRYIKADPQLKTVPVVMLTSSSEDRDLAMCYELGTNAYVVKPVDFADFVDALTQVGMFWAALNEPPRTTS